MNTKRERVLILCTGNSARSHIAEGYLRAKASNRFEVYSAGSNPSGYVHNCAIRTMKAIGIDISEHRSKHMSTFFDDEFDYVLTVCDNAAEECPIFPGKGQRIHHGFIDPAAAPDDVVMQTFDTVRDEIIVWLDDEFNL